MPTTVSDYAQTAQEQTLKTISQSQQAIVEAVKAWANAVEKAIPDVPTLPFADELPQPKELVQTSFEFADQLLKLQQQFVESIVDAASPVLGKSGEPVKSSGKAQADS